MLQWYQNLPLYINPVAFSVGSIEIHWYALMYLVGFLAVYFILIRELNKIKKSNTLPINSNFSGISKETIGEFILYAALGLIVGARLGYVLFYNFQYFWNNPLRVIMPYDFLNGMYTGISGMSYFGGLIGVVVAGTIYLKKKKIDFWQFSEFFIPAVPAGYFFGRIGNFLNGELYGRETKSVLGMYFSSGGSSTLRHPSQIYEAILEGLAIYLILLFFKKNSRFSGFLLVVYLFGYGLMRFLVEFVREPDSGASLIMNTLTLNQMFSIILMLVALILGLYLRKKRCYNLNNKAEKYENYFR
jgi:phosphatidylglycerol---prolipoprotein diacylglyceryl transferase